MSSISAHLGRVPNALSSSLLMRHLTGTNVGLLTAQEQLSTGRRINRLSDDPIGSAMVGLLDARLETLQQRERNLSHAQATLNTIDSVLGDITALAQDARSIGLSQIGVGSDPTTRLQQSQVIGQFTRELFQSINREFVGVSLFAGSLTNGAAFQEFHGGYRYLGDDGGLMTDLGFGLEFPITLGAHTAIGATSARVQGDVDLNAILTPETFLRDLRGPMAVNGPLGTLNITIDNGMDTTTIAVDLSGAETAGDVQMILNHAIESAAPGALAGLGVGITTDRFSVAVEPGYTITFDDGGVGQTAASLGLTMTSYTAGLAVAPDTEASLNPRITDRTRMSELDPAVAMAFGTIRFTNGDRSGTVTVTPNMTIGEFREQVRRLDLGISVQLNSNGDSLDIMNHVAGLRMSISETGGGLVATRLGIRSMQASTPIAHLNDGRGVQIADGVMHPETGLPDPQYNRDFRVYLSDGSSFTVDLRPEDMDTVQSVINRINAEAIAQGATLFSATLNPDGNGIVLSDTLGGPDAIRVESLNGYAAKDLGLLDGEATAGRLVGQDRGTVRVDSLFSTLIDLQRALESNDERGIQFATELFNADIDRAATARAVVGSRAQRVESTLTRLANEKLRDDSIRSSIRDIDPFMVTTRFQLLQAQLQTTIAAAAQNRPLSLLNYL